MRVSPRPVIVLLVLIVVMLVALNAGWFAGQGQEVDPVQPMERPIERSEEPSLPVGSPTSTSKTSGQDGSRKRVHARSSRTITFTVSVLGEPVSGSQVQLLSPDAHRVARAECAEGSGVVIVGIPDGYRAADLKGAVAIVDGRGCTPRLVPLRAGVLTYRVDLSPEIANQEIVLMSADETPLAGELVLLEQEGQVASVARSNDAGLVRFSVDRPGRFDVVGFEQDLAFLRVGGAERLVRSLDIGKADTRAAIPVVFHGYEFRVAGVEVLGVPPGDRVLAMWRVPFMVAAWSSMASTARKLKAELRRSFPNFIGQVYVHAVRGSESKVEHVRGTIRSLRSAPFEVEVLPVRVSEYEGRAQVRLSAESVPTGLLRVVFEGPGASSMRLPLDEAFGLLGVRKMAGWSFELDQGGCAELPFGRYRLVAREAGLGRFLNKTALSVKIGQRDPSRVLKVKITRPFVYADVTFESGGGAHYVGELGLEYGDAPFQAVAALPSCIAGKTYRFIVPLDGSAVWRGLDSSGRPCKVVTTPAQHEAGRIVVRFAD